MGIADKLFNMKNEKASANLKAGQDFLAANKQKPGDYRVTQRLAV